MPQTATLERPTAIAATLDLQDPAERQIFDIIQHFYGPYEVDRLHDIKRGTHEGKRIMWTLGSFRPPRRGALTEWSVVAWNIDEIELRFYPQPSQAAAKAYFLSR